MRKRKHFPLALRQKKCYNDNIPKNLKRFEVSVTNKQNPIPQKKRSILRVLYFFLAPFILLCSLEVMHLSFPKSIDAVLKDSYYPVKLLLSYLFVLSWQSLFYTLTQSSFTSNLINTCVMFMIGYSSEVLGRVNGNPLLPSDLLLIKNVKEIASFAEIPSFWSAPVAVAINGISLILHFIVCRLRPEKPKLFKRVWLSWISIGAFCLATFTICLSPQFRYGFLPKIGVQISAFNPIEDYNSNGAVLTFFPRIGDLVVKETENYSELAICALNSKYPTPQSVETKRKANVIIIQNEAWWDPAQMPEVTYSEDLLSGIRSLKKNTVKGTFLSPVYAGGTCMPEFEVVTGIPTYFLPSSAYPYTQYITDQTPSIVSVYQQLGYQTVALHPYKKNFYNRATAYPLLGFDTFKGMDEFESTEKSGAYIDDMSCVNQIIHEFENKTADRIFQFVVTMENHGTYTAPRYESFDFEMEAPTLSEEDYLDLQRYSQGVYNADKAFMALVEYFKTVDEPVILAMYGDHLPLLGTNGSTYMDSGFVEQSEIFVSSEHPQLYETPYVVWTNYNKPNFNLEKVISGNTLGLRLFLASGNEAPWYFGVLDEFSRKYPAVGKTALYHQNGEKITHFDPEDDALRQAYEILIYDILHGKQYCVKSSLLQTP